MIVLISSIYQRCSLLVKKSHFRISVKCRFKSWKVMFFGSDSFSLVSLDSERKEIEKLEVVSLSESSVVSKYALRQNLKLHIWPPELTGNFDIGVIASFGVLIPKEVIDYFPLGIINVHPSLLPKYRGAMPIFHTIKNGETVTGVSIMKIKPFKFDVGDIIMQKKCEVGKNEVMPSLWNKLAELGANCLMETMNNLPHCLDKSVPQRDDKASFAPKITKQIASINWEKVTAAELYNLYRGLVGVYDLETSWQNKSVKLKCISLEFNGTSTVFSIEKLPPGSIEYCEKNRLMRVHCSDAPIYICTIMIRHKLMVAHKFHHSHLQRQSKDKWKFK